MICDLRYETYNMTDRDEHRFKICRVSSVKTSAIQSVLKIILRITNLHRTKHVCVQGCILCFHRTSKLPQQDRNTSRGRTDNLHIHAHPFAFTLICTWQHIYTLAHFHVFCSCVIHADHTL